jgi:hypothetical protein
MEEVESAASNAAQSLGAPRLGCASPLAEKQRYFNPRHTLDVAGGVTEDGRVCGTSTVQSACCGTAEARAHAKAMRPAPRCDSTALQDKRYGVLRDFEMP